MSENVSASSAPSSARIVGVTIPFWDLVWLLVKVTLAAIPALIILALGGFVIAGMIAGFAHK